MSINTARHKDYFDFTRQPCTIIGAGATGSRVFEALVNLGITDIRVFDDDVIESHNLANQLYQTNQIGVPKVNALAAWEHAKTGDRRSKCLFAAEKVEGDMRAKLHGIVFLLTDTMSSRREIFRNSLRFNPNVTQVIETRMALAHGNVMAFDPNDLGQSSKWVFSLIDDDADTTETSACGTALTIGTTASIVANLAVNYMIHYLRGEEPDPVIEVFLEPLFINTSKWEK